MNKAISKIHFKNLDALRFIAFFSVFLFHFNPRIPTTDNAVILFLGTLFKCGYLGVNFFFVLSGFLITYLLLKEEALYVRYNVFNFWIRRALRIWPLYLAIVFYGFVVFRWLNQGNVLYNETAEAFWYLTFLPNFNIIVNGYPLCTSLIVLWSVGIEEQFYLFWPILFKPEKWRISIILTLIIASLIFRYAYSDSFFYITYHTASFIGDLALGCLLALIAFKRNWTSDRLVMNKVISLLCYLFGLSLILFNQYIEKSLSNLLFLKNFVFSLFFAFIIYDQVFVLNSWFKIGKIKLLETLGKYTYGMYCIHPIAIMLGMYVSRFIHLEDNLGWVIGPELAISLLLTVTLSLLSYSIIERPFLRMKEGYFSMNKNH